MRLARNALLGALCASLTAASPCKPAPPTQGPATVLSEKFPGARISYQETKLCETTKGVKSYSGYVVLPEEYIADSQGWVGDMAAHFFFWYFESRSNPDTAPTSIYLGGGAGATSFDFSSNFPCYVNPDSNSTTLNELSWNNEVNMLYIDQPLGTGFSYLSLLNGTMDLATGAFTAARGNETTDDKLNDNTVRAVLDQSAQGQDEVDWSLVTRTTPTAARNLWSFVQVWLNDFPSRRTTNDELSLWTISYGGFYGPAFVSHWLDQNELIAAGKPPLANATSLNLRTLGLFGSCMDSRAMAHGFPLFAHNNTYDIEMYDEDVFGQVTELIDAPEVGCLALIDKCRALAAAGDPLGAGYNETVNEACVAATELCFGQVQGAVFETTNRSYYDLTMSVLASHPDLYNVAFFNQAWVQEELGVPLNFTAGSASVQSAFFGLSGDPMIRDISGLEGVLNRDVNVAVAIGDRDYRCNWIGGENVTLSLDFPSAATFRTSGYASLVTNNTYNGGLVREHGNLSFSRVFQAGHGVSAYQPETMYRVFDRAMNRLDVATGEIQLGFNSTYATEGPLSVKDVKNKVPAEKLAVCYQYMAPISCTPEQREALANGTAIIEDFIVTSPKGLALAE